MVCIATSYVNPDTDGVAGCVALVELSRLLGFPERLVTVTEGSINTETKALFTLAQVDLPVTAGDIPLDQVVGAALVDTHHPAQLPAWLDTSVVKVVFDHHPGGTPASFPAASIRNEAVGAACTLIAERYFSEGHAVPVEVAVVLQGGILSNTLDFAAPSTTERDKAAFAELDALTGRGDEIRSAMQAERARFVEGPTRHIIAADLKSFDEGHSRLGMSQLEAPGASAVAGRDDFWEAYALEKEARRLDVLLVNLADLAASASVLAVSDPTWQHRLSREYGIVFEHGLAWTAEIFLRKTHLVPLMAPASD